MSVVSMSVLTVWAAVVAISATFLLIATDVRQPARRPGRSARGVGVPQVPVTRLPTPLYCRPAWWRRFASLIGVSALTITAGLVLGITLLAAIVAAFVMLGRALG